MIENYELYFKACAERIKGNSPKAAELFRKLAEEGHPRAMFHLGMMYLNEETQSGENCTEEDYCTAWSLIEESAKKGFASAQDEMGNRFLLGDGVPVNQDEATRWFDVSGGERDFKAKFPIREVSWENKSCTAETLHEIVTAYKNGGCNNYGYVCKALQESNIQYDELKVLSKAGNMDALVLMYIGLHTEYHHYRLDEFIDDDTPDLVMHILHHIDDPIGGKHIFVASKKEQNAVRRKMFSAFQSLDKEAAYRYRLTFQDSEDQDVLLLFAQMGFQDALEELMRMANHKKRVLNKLPIAN